MITWIKNKLKKEKVEENLTEQFLPKDLNSIPFTGSYVILEGDDILGSYDCPDKAQEMMGNFLHNGLKAYYHGWGE